MISTLVVDDDVRVADVHAAYVRRVPGFEVVAVAHSARETLDALERARVDLVLLDLYLPDRPGLELLRELRAGDRAPVDVIVVTAARDSASVRSAIQAGAVHYLVKPFRFDALRERLTAYRELRSHLGGRRPVSQGDVDRAFELLRPPATGQLPKGLSAPTLRHVADGLGAAGGDVSAAELAGRLGMSRAAVQRYLTHLCRTGAARMTLRYGQPGRPEHRFHATGG